MDPCPICLDDIPYNKKVTIHGCYHIFCYDCMDKLLDGNILTCPLCRGKINKYIHRDEMVHIVIRSNTVTNTVTNTINTVNTTIYYRFVIVQWIIMVAMLMFAHNLHETNKSINQLVSNAYDKNTLLQSNYGMCREKTINDIYLAVKMPPFIDGDVYNYCKFPEYYVNRCIN